MTPPAPLNSRVAPIKSGATACTLRAKNFRRSRAPLSIGDLSLGDDPQDNCSASTRPRPSTLCAIAYRPDSCHGQFINTPPLCLHPQPTAVTWGPPEHVPTQAIEFRERA